MENFITCAVVVKFSAHFPPMFSFEPSREHYRKGSGGSKGNTGKEWVKGLSSDPLVISFLPNITNEWCLFKK